MTLDIRVLTEDDLETATNIFAHAFGTSWRHDPGERKERLRQGADADWYLGAFEDGEMTSMMRIIPNEMYLNGGTLGFGAVSPVAGSPLHRRKGHTGALLRRSLEVMKDRGQPVSGLYTPHPAFYRRYGWEIAAEVRKYVFKPKDLSLQYTPSQRGSFRALRPADRAELEPVYAQYAARGNGPFVRDERWWDNYVVGANWRGEHDIVLWHDKAGTPQGYAVFILPRDGEDANKVVVVELIALTGDAYANLLTYFGNYDLHSEVIVYGSPHEPMLLQFLDTERLTAGEEFSVLLRITDFEAAMSARLPARADETAQVVLRIEDRDAAWNAGTWRAGVAEGRTLVSRTDEAPELTVTERILAPLFNGYLRPSVAHEAGLLTATDEDALDRADRIFAVKRPPYFPDHF